MNNTEELSLEIEELLKQTPDNMKNTQQYMACVYSLMCAYESEGKIDNAIKVAKEIIDKSVDEGLIFDEQLRTAYDVLARSGDFESYCIALEWNRPMEKKFYLPRAKILKKHGVIQAFQDLQDDKLDLLVLNMPPRVGKSTLSLFFLTFRAGLYPEQSILGNGHSTSLTQSFYKEFLNIVESDEYRYKEIFPRVAVTTKNAEYSYLDFNEDKRFHTAMFRSVEGGTTGLAEASNLLYCDDLVKDVEQANSKDRLDKLYYSYTATIKDRKVTRKCKDGVYRPCPELHVNTPWSIYDVTSRIVKTEIQKGNNDRTRVISIPCWDENHESNFLYDCGKGFDVKYYEDMQLAEDPVIFSAKYLMNPIERDGHPFEKEALTYFTELPEGNPDRIVAYNDVAHGGDDYMSMPVAYVYGRDVYINDVLFIHNFDGDSYSRPMVCQMLMINNVAKCGFEKNNGGDFYSTLISQDLRKIGYRCNITAHNASTKSSKLDRILSCSEEIKGTSTLEGTFRIYFKDPKLIRNNSQYMTFLQNLWNWSQKDGAIQKRQHDDAPDSLAGLLINVLGKQTRGSFRLYDIREAGY
jgi:hypothetical protein